MAETDINTPAPLYTLPEDQLPPAALLQAITEESVAVAAHHPNESGPYPEDEEVVISALRGYGEKLLDCLIALSDVPKESRFTPERIRAAHFELSKVPTTIDRSIRNTFQMTYSTFGQKVSLRTPLLDRFVEGVIKRSFTTQA
jgi:hypothetical protein